MHAANATIKSTNCYLNADTDKTTVIHRYMITLTDRQSIVMLSIMGVIVSILALTVLTLALFTYYQKKRYDVVVGQLNDMVSVLSDLNQLSNRRSVRFAKEVVSVDAPSSGIQT